MVTLQRNEKIIVIHQKMIHRSTSTSLRLNPDIPVPGISFKLFSAAGDHKDIIDDVLQPLDWIKNIKFNNRQ